MNIITCIGAVLTTHVTHIITIFPAGNDIDLKHSLTIINSTYFSSFNKLTWPKLHELTSPSSCFVMIFENKLV